MNPACQANPAKGRHTCESAINASDGGTGGLPNPRLHHSDLVIASFLSGLDEGCSERALWLGVATRVTFCLGPPTL